MIEGKRIIAIPPAYNEEGKIGKVISKIPEQIVDKILVVCDGCTDNTEKEAKNSGARVLSYTTRKGIGFAIRTGIEFALKEKYDIIVILAGNDKDNPTEIINLVRPLIYEGYDYIQGSRYLPEANPDNFLFTERLVHDYIRYLSVSLPDIK